MIDHIPAIDSIIDIDMPLNIVNTSPNVIAKNNQNIGSDQFFTLAPSSGPKGSMLKAPKIALPHIHNPTVSAKIGWNNTLNSKPPPIIPIKNNTIFAIGPAIEIIPFSLRPTRPATMTAPGAMKRKPMKKAMRTPVLRPL